MGEFRLPTEAEWEHAAVPAPQPGSHTGTCFNVENTSGGIFNGSVPEATQEPNYGTITIEFISCNEAKLTYDFPSAGRSGEMTLTRVLPDNIPLCEMLSEL